MERIDDAPVGPADAVPVLAHLPEAGRVQGLEADQHESAARSSHPIEQPLVARDVDADLARPAPAQRLERVEQRLQVGLSAKEVVVDEEQELSLGQTADLRDQPVHGSHAKVRAVEGMDRAEVAREAAATSVLDQLDRRVALAAVDGSLEPVVRERALVAAG